MNWFLVYFFVTAQTYPDPSVDVDSFIAEHARRNCLSYNASFFDTVIEVQRSGKRYERPGYLYTARCYLYDFGPGN